MPVLPHSLRLRFLTVKHPLEFTQQLGELLGKRGVIGQNREGEDIHPHSLRDPVRSGIVQFLWHLPPSRYEIAPLILRNGKDTANSKLISCSQYSLPLSLSPSLPLSLSPSLPLSLSPSLPLSLSPSLSLSVSLQYCIYLYCILSELVSLSNHVDLSRVHENSHTQ